MISKHSLMNGFAKVENDDANNKALLITDAVHSITEGLASKAADWAAWDDAYQYVQDRNEKFVESNFAENALENLKVDILAVFDVKGQPIRLSSFDLENEKQNTFPQSLKQHFLPNSDILNHTDAESVKTGLINVPEGFLLFASRPVVNSDMDKPIKGTMIFGRFLSPKQVAKLSELTHQKIEQYNFNATDLPEEVLWAKTNFPDLDKNNSVKAVSKVAKADHISGFSLMYDYYGKPAAIYKSNINRVIYSQGEKSLNVLLWLIFASVTIIGVVLIVSLDKTILTRLITMASEVEAVDTTGKQRVSVKGTDEISTLGQKVNNMLLSIEENTEQIKSVNETISTMLNSVTQGFFLFNKSGHIDSNYSAACEKIFEQSPSDKHLAEVLKTSKADLNDWLETVFMEVIDFRSLAELGPQSFENLQGMKIDLKYYPVRNQKNELTAVVCIATDITNELIAKQQLEEQKVFADRVTKIAKSKNDFLYFVNETRKLLNSAEAELSNKIPDVSALYRHIHTVKGGAGAFSLDKVQHFAHQFESELGSLRKSTPAMTESKVTELKFNLEKLKNLFEHIVNEHSDLLGAGVLDGENRVEIPFSRLKNFYELIRSTAPYEKLQYNFLAEFVSQPVEKSFLHYNEVVQHLSQRLDKMVAPIQFENEKLMICHEPYRELFTSLVHVFRNIVDHGIETPEERDLSGKDIEGKISVHFDRVHQKNGEQLKIVIKDDGAGINLERVKAKLEASGQKFNHFSEYELLNKIFESGFSTSEKISETSGRGVGMDAVLHACKNLGGTCELTSVLGQGVTLNIEVPFYTGFVHSEATSKSLAS